MANIILFHFEQYDIRYVGDGINHEWVAQDVFEAIGVPGIESSKFLEYKETMTFADCLSFAAEYPIFDFAAKLRDFVIDISGARLWRALYARQFDVFVAEYFVWEKKYSEELSWQSIFFETYKNGDLPGLDGIRLIDKDNWPKIPCFPDFLFSGKNGLIPGEMKKGNFTPTNLSQLQRYMERLGSERGVAIAQALSVKTVLPSNVSFVAFQPLPYEEYCRLAKIQSNGHN